VFITHTLYAVSNCDISLKENENKTQLFAEIEWYDSKMTESNTMK